MSELSAREQLILDCIRDSERQMTSLVKRLTQFDVVCMSLPALKAEERSLRYSGSLRVDRKNLPKLRKAVGRLKVTTKSVPYNFDTTNELIIHVKPQDEAFSELSFYYRAPLKGERCKVETQVSTYKTLVCKK